MNALDKVAYALCLQNAKGATERVQSSMWANGKDLYRELAKVALESLRGFPAKRYQWDSATQWEDALDAILEEKE